MAASHLASAALLLLSLGGGLGGRAAHGLGSAVARAGGSGEWVDGRVVGGAPAGARAVRSLAHIFVSHAGGFVGSCSATVLGAHWLLTAAHCFQDERGRTDGLLVARSGAYALQASALMPAGARVHWFAAVFVHRRYANPRWADFRHDVALVRLARPLRGFRAVRIAAPPRGGTRVAAVGYGLRGDAGPYARRLMQAPVVVRSFGFCSRFEEPRVRDVLSRRGHVCAVGVGFPGPQTDTCYGDSGGPLFRMDAGSGRLRQCAITSFSSSGCAAPYGTPWYVRVVAYKRAIYSVVRKGRWRRNFKRFVA